LKTKTPFCLRYIPIGEYAIVNIKRFAQFLIKNCNLCLQNDDRDAEVGDMDFGDGVEGVWLPLGAGIPEIVERISQLRAYSPWIEASPVSFRS